jgi:hypothetical protein
MSRPIRNFTEMLGLLSRGKFSEKLNAELETAIETLEAMPSEKGKATMTISLTLAYQGGRLDISPTVKTKLPEGEGFRDTPFWTYEGGLSVQHPSQMDFLGLKEVDGFDKAAPARSQA